MDYSLIKGRIFNIQRFSIHDGPGIRTLIFLKGCPLKCWWCSNPEGITKEFNLIFYSDKCSYCGACVKVCPNAVHKIENKDYGNIHLLIRERCNYCRQCVNLCYKQALNIVGDDLYIHEIFKDILTDIVFYDQSGGGVTIGGGEPMYQPEITFELIKKCKLNNINTAIETCGLFEWNKFKDILKLLDYVLIDIKMIDALKHFKYTGAGNEIILKNIRKILLQDEREVSLLPYMPVIIRIPVIPNINDSRKDLTAAAIFLAKNNSKNILQYVDLLPYHEYGRHKYIGLGIKNKMDVFNKFKIDESFLIDAKKIFNRHGFLCKINGV